MNAISPAKTPTGWLLALLKGALIGLMALLSLPAMASSFNSVPGWSNDDHGAALAAFTKTCHRQAALRPLCDTARTLQPSQARQFFETHFTPHKVSATPGKLTGYYQASIQASLKRHGAYQYPIHGRPSDLVKQGDQWLQRTASGLRPYPARAAIMNGAIDDTAPVLFWAKSPVDVFFAHVQGSAMVALDTGAKASIGFAARNGQPYVAIGKVMLERGYLPSDQPVTMEAIRGYLEANPDKIDSILASNPSYIFFTRRESVGAVGAANVPLTPYRSLAIDPQYAAYGTPIFIHAQPSNSFNQTFAQLMIAQDTGAAIRGQQRGDFFTGYGEEAAQIAGDLNNPVFFYILKPHDR